MSKYIDAEALKKILLAKAEQEMNKITYPHSWSFAYLNFAESLKAIPTADVEPVRHGHWIYHEIVSTDEGLIGAYECSVCHAGVPEAVFDFLMEGFHKNYCGACGAKMDGKENKE